MPDEPAENSVNPGAAPALLTTVPGRRPQRRRIARQPAHAEPDRHNPGKARTPRHVVLDQRHAPAEDFKLHELTWAVAQLERSSTAEDLAKVAWQLATLLAGATDGELRRTFRDWLWVTRQPLVGGDPTPRPPRDLDLEDMAMSLADRVAEWPKPYIEQGLKQGISLGREQGMSLGHEQGREETMEHERQMLRRIAAARFGSATADRLAATIAAEADPDRLMAVGVAIGRCATGRELLREIGNRR